MSEKESDDIDDKDLKKKNQCRMRCNMTLSLTPMQNVDQSLCNVAQGQCAGVLNLTLGFQDGKMVQQPQFGELTFGDAGVYVCEVSMAGLTRHQSFELVVEGQCSGVYDIHLKLTSFGLASCTQQHGAGCSQSPAENTI